MSDDPSNAEPAKPLSEAELLLHLEEALALPEHDRDAWLEAKALHPASAARLHRLLSADTVGALKTTALQTQISRIEFEVGKRVGAFEIIELLGSGGMGEVYLAERADGEFDQRVAIKLLRSGQTNPMLDALFRNERQILAGLNHPNIASLIDGGHTEDGALYVVIEYIDGVDVATYVRDHQLSVADVLRLFTQICQGVAAAHSALVIHRDIKPGNVIVSAQGEPKLLDFGIAGTIDAAGELTSTPAMTPSYASPEQLRGGRLTTASDIYSLGVLLFELLAGAPPYGRRNLTPVQLDAQIASTEPPKPSERSDSARAEGLRGDVDAIVVKAMNEEPERRYRSVDDLIEDLRRTLNHEPVRARPDSLGYRLGKFVRRNAVGVAASAVAVAAITVGLVVSLVQTRIAEEQRDQAELRFSETRELVNYLMDDLYGELDVAAGGSELRADIARVSKRYLDGLTATRPNDPELLIETAQGYRQLGDMQASPQEASAGDEVAGRESYLASIGLLDQARSLSGPEAVINFEQAVSQVRLARLEYTYTSDPDRWRDLATEAEQALTRLTANGAPVFDQWIALVDARFVLADGLSYYGEPESAAGYLERVRADVETHMDSWGEPRQQRSWRANLVRVLATQAEIEFNIGDFGSAREAAEAMIALVEERSASARGQQDLNLKRAAAVARYHSARASAELSDFDSALKRLNEGIDVLDSVLATDARDEQVRGLRFDMLQQSADALFELGDADGSIERYRAFVAYHRGRFEDGSRSNETVGALAGGLLSLAQTLAETGQTSAACAEWQALAALIATPDSQVLAADDRARLRSLSETGRAQCGAP